MYSIISAQASVMPLYPLSKTQLKTGLQCPLRLYLSRTEPRKGGSLDAFSQKLIDDGNRVGELARQRFANGVLVHEGPGQWQQAHQKTLQYLEDPCVPALFEGALFYKDERVPHDPGLLVRTDVLERVDSNDINQQYKKFEQILDDLQKLLYSEWSSHALWTDLLFQVSELKIEVNGFYHLNKHCEILEEWLSVYTAKTIFIKEARDKIFDKLASIKKQAAGSTALMLQADLMSRWMSGLGRVNLRDKANDFITHFRDNVVLERLQFSQEGLFNLVEVKSTTSVVDKEGQVKKGKMDYVFDLAIQLYVAQKSGLHINQAGIMHVSRDYCHPGGDGHDPKEFLTYSDLSVVARDIKPEVKGHLVKMRSMILDNAKPDEEFGAKCRQLSCGFERLCREDQSNTHISRLYYFNQALEDFFKSQGIEDIRDIPKDINDIIKGVEGLKPLTPVQLRMIESVKTGEVVFDRKGLKQELSKIKGPIHFLDFETIFGAFPLVKGTSPYDQVPLQFSNHIQGEDKALQHVEYLYEANPNVDPLREFAEQLIQAVGDEGSVVVYNAGFEKARISYLAKRFADLEDKLIAINKRVVDLLVIVRNNVYHPEFESSFSLKKVLPALVPNFSYQGLDISRGDLASKALEELVNSETPQAKKDEIREGLLEYCGMDTMAMVKVLEVLQEMVD